MDGVNKKKLSKAYLLFQASRRRKPARNIKIVNLDPKNAVLVEMQAGKRANR